MQKRLIAVVILIAYGAFLINLMVFRNVPTIRIGHLLFKFGGTDANGQANFVPFKTIVPYLLGKGGWIIAGVNLVGNVAILVPFGFLVPCAFRNMSWRESFAIAVAAGLLIEGMQVVFRTGIFDIDDVILNALGVMLGYWAFAIFVKGRESV